MLPYLAKGFADVVTVKDPELRLSWILGSCKSLQRTFLAAGNQRNGSMMEGSHFAGFENGGWEQLLEDAKDKEIILPYSPQKEHRLFSP